MFANLLAKAGIAALVAASTSYAASLPEISVSGSKFYDPEGNQFFIKGMCPPSFEGSDHWLTILQELRIN